MSFFKKNRNQEVAANCEGCKDLKSQLEAEKYYRRNDAISWGAECDRSGNLEKEKKFLMQQLATLEGICEAKDRIIESQNKVIDQFERVKT